MSWGGVGSFRGEVTDHDTPAADSVTPSLASPITVTPRAFKEPYELHRA
jgi:hypothetical protein